MVNLLFVRIEFNAGRAGSAGRAGRSTSVEGGEFDYPCALCFVFSMQLAKYMEKDSHQHKATDSANERTITA